VGGRPPFHSFSYNRRLGLTLWDCPMPVLQVVDCGPIIIIIGRHAADRLDGFAVRVCGFLTVSLPAQRLVFHPPLNVVDQERAIGPDITKSSRATTFGLKCVTASLRWLFDPRYG